MKWTPRPAPFTVALTVAAALTGTLFAAAEARLLAVFPRPHERAVPVGVVSTGRPYHVLVRRAEWTLIRQDEVQGWIHRSDRTRLPPCGSSLKSILPPAEPFSPKASEEWRSETGLEGLIHFALGDRERLDRMSDPVRRLRISNVSDRWGPLFYRRTRDYYVRGIYLWDLDEERVRFGLFKRRLYYENLLGNLGSQQAMEQVLNSAPGWQGNRGIFGKGREYYLELSLHF